MDRGGLVIIIIIITLVTMNDIREVPGVPELGTEVGAEVSGDEVRGRPVAELGDGVDVQAALVEPLQLEELLVVTVVQAEDQV